jgi:hypothetical protein
MPVLFHGLKGRYCGFGVGGFAISFSSLFDSTLFPSIVFSSLFSFDKRRVKEETDSRAHLLGLKYDL